MSSHDGQPDPDDLFSDTRMTFGEHIEDLRTHLMRAIKGFVICFLLAFLVAKPILKWIERPVKNQLMAFWEKYYKNKEAEFRAEHPQQDQPPITLHLRVRESDLKPKAENAKKGQRPLNLLPAFARLLRSLDLGHGVEAAKIDDEKRITFEAEIVNSTDVIADLATKNRIVFPPGLTTLSATEALMVYFKVAMVTGLVLGSPWILLQLWLFVAAGLYPHEKKYIHLALPFSVFLFLFGVFVCEFYVIEKAVEALLWFNEWLDFPPELRLNEWLGFAIFMPLVFGISFQTPLVMLALQRIGIFTIEAYRNKRKISWFLMALFAAVITPSVDPFSMVLLWAPMGLLYEVGIWLCSFLPGRPLLEFEETEADETVEV